MITSINKYSSMDTSLRNLLRIHTTLKTTTSELAVTFGVTNQTIYDWVNDGIIPNCYADKLQDLADAADILVANNVSINRSLLKRKFTNNRSLLQVTQAGDSAKVAAALLVWMIVSEANQLKRIRKRMVNRQAGHATADFDLPF